MFSWLQNIFIEFTLQKLAISSHSHSHRTKKKMEVSPSIFKVTLSRLPVPPYYNSMWTPQLIHFLKPPSSDTCCTLQNNKKKNQPFEPIKAHGPENHKACKRKIQHVALTKYPTVVSTCFLFSSEACSQFFINGEFLHDVIAIHKGWKPYSRCRMLSDVNGLAIISTLPTPFPTTIQAHLTSARCFLSKHTSTCGVSHAHSLFYAPRYR